MIIKARSEDFIVEEVTTRYGKLDYFKEYDPINLKEENKHLICVLKKRNVETFSFIKTFSRYMRFSPSRISLSGTKDKVACTVQLMSIHNLKKEKLKKLSQFKYNGVNIYPIEYSDKKIYLGEHKGNFFTITLRQLEKDEIDKLNALPSSILFPNYYGVQRFGEGKVKSWEIGREILKRRWHMAVKLILENALNEKVDFESESFFNLSFSPFRSYEKKLYDYLLHHQAKDFFWALKSLPTSLLQMYVHSYQSWIFNLVVKEFGRDIKDYEVHIPGYNFEGYVNEGEVEKRIKEIMIRDGIEENLFYIKELNIKSEGLIRKAYVKAESFEILEVEKDNMYRGYYKAKVRFFLPRGSYATVFLEEILK